MNVSSASLNTMRGFSFSFMASCITASIALPLLHLSERTATKVSAWAATLPGFAFSGAPSRAASSSKNPPMSWLSACQS